MRDFPDSVPESSFNYMDDAQRFLTALKAFDAALAAARKAASEAFELLNCNPPGDLERDFDDVLGDVRAELFADLPAEAENRLRD